MTTLYLSSFDATVAIFPKCRLAVVKGFPDAVLVMSAVLSSAGGGTVGRPTGTGQAGAQARHPRLAGRVLPGRAHPAGRRRGGGGGAAQEEVAAAGAPAAAPDAAWQFLTRHEFNQL